MTEDINIHINPESIGKFMAISDVPESDVPDPEGYESPITGYIGQFSQQIIEQRDNAVVAQISEQIAVDVNKEELIKALNYDRNQYNEGYRRGYKDGKEEASTVIIKITKDGKTWDAYLDKSRMIISVHYMTTEAAEMLGYTWEEDEEKKGRE